MRIGRPGSPSLRGSSEAAAISHHLRSGAGVQALHLSLYIGLGDRRATVDVPQVQQHGESQPPVTHAGQG